MSYEYKISCVVDAENYYVTVVKVDLMPVAKASRDTSLDAAKVVTETEWVVYCYTLQDGERTVDAPPPAPRPYAGADGFIRPKWEDAASTWTEGATDEEIAAWELEHPAPEPPLPSPQEDADALLVDHEYRLSLLELGVN